MAIAPLPSSAALAWLDHARKTLNLVEAASSPFHLPLDVRESFHAYLDEWMWAADAAQVFRWEGDIDPEVARHLVHHWHVLACALESERERCGFPRRPAEADVFYIALVVALTDALAGDQATSAFGEGLRGAWPGVTA